MKKHGSLGGTIYIYYIIGALAARVHASLHVEFLSEHSSDHNASALAAMAEQEQVSKQVQDLRQVYQSSEYQAVHDVYWRNQRPERGPPTPVVSAANTPQEGSVAGAGRMEVDSVAARGPAATGSAQLFYHAATVHPRDNTGPTGYRRFSDRRRERSQRPRAVVQQAGNQKPPGFQPRPRLPREGHPPRVLHPRSSAGGRTPQR